jgi:hypothetical protein
MEDAAPIVRGKPPQMQAARLHREFQYVKLGIGPQGAFLGHP